MLLFDSCLPPLYSTFIVFCKKWFITVLSINLNLPSELDDDEIPSCCAISVRCFFFVGFSPYFDEDVNGLSQVVRAFFLFFFSSILDFSSFVLSLGHWWFICPSLLQLNECTYLFYFLKILYASFLLRFKFLNGLYFSC